MSAFTTKTEDNLLRADFTDPYLKGYIYKQAAEKRATYQAAPIIIEDFENDFTSLTKLYGSINDVFDDRFSDGHRDTYRDDSTNYAEQMDEWSNNFGDRGALILMDIEKLRVQQGDEWADSMKNYVSDALQEVNGLVGYARDDSDFWSKFEDEADYSAAMFNQDMFTQHGMKSGFELDNAIDANYNLMGSIFADSDYLNEKLAENQWLEVYKPMVATRAYYEKLKKDTEDTYGALSERYDAISTSAENMEIFNELQTLQQEIASLDTHIKKLDKQAYYTDMGAELDDLSEQLAADILNIPYLEDEKSQLIGDGIGDLETSLGTEDRRQEISTQIDSTRQQLLELGYSNKEIVGFIIYANHLYDKEQGEANLTDSIAYAEAHPVEASIGSVVGNFFAILDPLDVLEQKIRNLLRGENIPINEYSLTKQFAAEAEATRDTVAGMIEDSTGSQFLSNLYQSGMTGVDIVAQLMATGGVSSVTSLAKGLGAVVKAFGDDFVRMFLKTYGDDAVRVLAVYGDDAVRAIATYGDDAAKLLASYGDDVGRALPSFSNKSLGVVGRNLVDDMVDDWYGVKSGSDDAAKDVATSWDDVADDALAAPANTGYNGSAGAGELIDGIKITDGKVGGKIPVDEFKTIRQSSIKNQEANFFTLGKHTAGLDSYISRAGSDSAYFDLGDEWGKIQDLYQLSDAEMFGYFNKPALADAIAKGKIIRFSHNPLDYSGSFLADEWEYLVDVLHLTDGDLIYEGGFWYVK